jgi:Tfp pilus assembly protein FimV
VIPGQPRATSQGTERLAVSLVLNAAWRAPDTLLVRVANGETTPVVNASSGGETLTLSAPAAGNGKRVCHQVASGETLWRIAATLAQNGTVTGAAGDTYSYLLAIVDDNRPLMGNSIRVKAGDTLYCPAPQTLARFDALSAAERQQRFARLEQGR